ncbi:MAG TPA: cell division protein FtsA [Pelagibacteraceae bacterium]|jgi:cell division protein FtsA|nr:cell division protein FtsA [Pelagibacteraceae bacterium]
MNSEDSIGIIELGNINIKCLIFKIKDNNESEILSTSITSSEGIHNGIVVNLTKASKAIRSCISIAEKKAKILLKKINVVLEGPEFLSTKFTKHKKINGSKIHKDDIDFLLKEAKKQLILNDKKQSIIHIFNHNYVVDGKAFSDEPIGVYADSLSHEITFITIPKNNLKNINQAFIDCDIEIERLISNTFALGAKLLNNKELEFGSILVDIGFEKISLGLFKNLALVHSITLPMGINHITKDISKVCSLSMDESVVIRNNIDFSFQNNQNLFDANGYLKNSYFINSSFRKISKNLILNVIKARLDEIFETVKKQIIVPEFNLNSGIGFLLVGGGSYLPNIEKHCEKFFGPRIKKLSDNNNEKETDLEKNFASCLGALRIIKDGWETEAIPETVDKNAKNISFLAKIFRTN